MDTLEWNAFQCDELNKTEQGKLILCESREENSSRLFIHQFSHIMNALTKNGWWDTFTLCSPVCNNKGFYLCVINKFRIDRNGYLNVMVTPMKFLGEKITEESAAWDLFFLTGLFCRQYCSRGYHLRFNTDYLFSLYKDDIVNADFSDACKIIFNKFLQDEITLEEIASALDEKNEIEKLAEDLIKNLAHHTDKYSKYPLICKKLPTTDGYYFYDDVESWLKRKILEFDTLHLENGGEVLDRVEAVLQYWVDFHKKEKEEKKAAKKAAKAAI